MSLSKGSSRLLEEQKPLSISFVIPPGEKGLSLHHCNGEVTPDGYDGRGGSSSREDSHGVSMTGTRRAGKPFRVGLWTQASRRHG